MQAIEAAYAIRSEPTPGTLDPAYDMSDSHFQSLFPTLVLATARGSEPRRGARASARSGPVASVPETSEVRTRDQARQGPAAGAGSLPGSGTHADGPRVFVEDKAVRQKLINICNPLELGQDESTDKTHFVLEQFLENHFNKMLAQSGQPHPHRGRPAPMDRSTGRTRVAEGDPEPADSGLCRSDKPFFRLGTAGILCRHLMNCQMNSDLVEQTLPDLKDWKRRLSVSRTSSAMPSPSCSTPPIWQPSRRR